ncbi:hypothetical protein SAMD00019534_034860 [Acytostelium subglobosum LB1]|uniref:hypothetical protein n=1 Tax=Acytostelium subglobosum LB1 TaxID=1410327 RepID=UPI0006452399|nr:hypothetical protein SAMD00019534_034860 [Acytostelium subglobosum LB1]GAM20311.1 hypothetical protein SAMD00019534_034860 [Acytostelium subglobosum LB1]|eukprot:XP_012759832.1 hypothetical protein SAMD00019534_034860 [Acytostelium subglobosum LB1]
MKQVLSVNIYDLTKSANRYLKTTIAQPVEIGTFSYDADNNVFPPVINKYKQPELPCDLTVGYNIDNVPVNGPSPLAPILSTLSDKKYDVTKVDFITYRNNLNKIFGTCINRNPWTIDIERLDNTVHLGINFKQEKFDDDHHAKSVYGGFKFEQYCMSDDTDLKYCSIVQTELKGHKIVLAAEIDCCIASTQQQPQSQTQQQHHSVKRKLESDEDTTTEAAAAAAAEKTEYVELKTANEIKDDKAKHTFERFKLFTCWLQSYLAGVGRIVFGFKDSNMVVNKLTEIRTLDIPSMVGGKWSQNECLLKGHEILSFIKRSTHSDKQYQLQFNHPNLILFEVEESSSTPSTTEKDGTGSSSSSTTTSILPNDYKEYFQSLKNKHTGDSDVKRVKVE